VVGGYCYVFLMLGTKPSKQAGLGMHIYTVEQNQRSRLL
jgi:hypothetical protein